VAYQRAFSTLGCADLSLVEVFDLARRHRITAIELRALGGSLDLPAVFAASHETPENLARTLRGEPVQVVAVDTSLRLTDGTAEDRAAFLQFVPWAEALGVCWLRVFDGGSSADSSEIAAMTDALEWWRKARAKRGWQVDVMVETHDSLFTAEKVGRLLAAAPETAILWDSHHTWKRGGEDPVATWTALAPHVVHVHVKDSISRPSAKLPFTYVLPGAGEFPAATLMERLRREFSGVVSLEWERLWHPYLPPVDEALSATTQNGWW
jgi:sugar phosphate isomerase/epimerase